MVDIMDGTTFLKVATYSCYPGYDLKGPSSRVCWSMEKWSAREPRCVAKGNYFLNPLYTNGFFLLVLYNKLAIIHCTYLGASGYNFKKYCILLSVDLSYF